jgi:hypothetical protein
MGTSHTQKKKNKHSLQLPSVLQGTAKQQKIKGFSDDTTRKSYPYSSTSCNKWVAVFVVALRVTIFF